MLPQIKVLSGSSGHYLTQEIVAALNMPLTEVQLDRFSDGEMQPIICESVRGDALFLVQSTYSPADNLLELLLMIDAAKRASAAYITAVIPYYGYARQDRKDKSRVPISSKLIANLLTIAGASRLITMDLHTPQIQGFFDIPVDHLSAASIFLSYLKEHLPNKNFVFAAPDVGGTKRARTFAKALNTELVIFDKRRDRPNEVSDMNVIGTVENKDIILIDDIIDTGGTICKAAAIAMERGARSVRAMITHPVLSGKAYDNINTSALTELIVCNTIPLQQQSDKIKQLSVATLFATAIRNVFEHRSVSILSI